MKLDQSANGAAYDSQGQVRSEAEHVAPGDEIKFTCPALKGRDMYFGLSGLTLSFVCVTRGDALRACPWLSYSAPLALHKSKLVPVEGFEPTLSSF